MLTPEYLDSMTDDIVALYQQLETDIVSDAAKRIAKIGMSESSVWQIEIVQELGSVHEDIMMRIAEMSGKAEKELELMFEEAGGKAVSYDNAIFQKAGLHPLKLKQSPAMMQILLSGIAKTNATIRNLTGTTATTTQTAFYSVMNKAYMQVSSGAFSYTQAITQAVKSLSDKGVTVIRYDKSGRAHRDKVDVAVRRAALTGVSQTTGQISWQNCDDMGCDLVETTAHYGARDDHAEWQGQIFSRSGRHPKYPSFIDVTGYGTGAGLKGWNCRHDFFAFFEGISSRTYSDKDLRDMKSAEVTFKGESIPLYKATQKQRSMERGIRASKRELVALDSSIKAANDDPALQKELQQQFANTSVLLKKKEAKYKEFAKQTDMKLQNERNQVYGFGRSTAQKAVHANKREKKKLTNR